MIPTIEQIVTMLETIIENKEKEFFRDHFIHQRKEWKVIIEHFDNSFSRQISIVLLHDRKTHTDVKILADDLIGFGDGYCGMRDFVHNILDEQMFIPENFELRKVDDVLVVKSLDLREMVKKHKYLLKYGFEPFGEMEKDLIDQKTEGTTNTRYDTEEYVAEWGFLFNTIGTKTTGSKSQSNSKTEFKYEYKRAYVKVEEN